MIIFTGIRWVFTDSEGEELPQDAISGYPRLIIDGIKGQTARINDEQKLLASGYRAVYLGNGFEEDPDFDLQHESGLLHGFSIDPSIVQLVLEFMAAIEAQTFSPQVILQDVTKAQPPANPEE